MQRWRNVLLVFLAVLVSLAATSCGRAPSAGTYRTIEVDCNGIIAVQAEMTGIFVSNGVSRTFTTVEATTFEGMIIVSAIVTQAGSDLPIANEEPGSTSFSLPLDGSSKADEDIHVSLVLRQEGDTVNCGTNLRLDDPATSIG